MTTKIRQTITMLSMVVVLLSVTTLSVFAGSWHASLDHYWKVGRACTDSVQIVARAHFLDNLPLIITREAYVYTGTVPADTWADAPPDTLGPLLGDVEIKIQHRTKPLYYLDGGVQEMTHYWGQGKIPLSGLDPGDLIFVASPSGTGFIVALEKCPPGDITS